AVAGIVDNVKKIRAIMLQSQDLETPDNRSLCVICLSQDSVIAKQLHFRRLIVCCSSSREQTFEQRKEHQEREGRKPGWEKTYS
ncbi:MAG: hypothetical protein ACK58T_23115, partial [Phycisphaerae bacterium]